MIGMRCMSWRILHRSFGRVLVAILALMMATSVSAACSENFVELRGDWGGARFRVEIADTEAERNKGLMFRESMSAGAGMLFIYPNTQRAIAFWMRNTLIPLDMLFFDDSGTLRHIHSNAVPHDETPISGGPGIRYVLEINGGLARGMGISVGSQMRHPTIHPNVAIWRC